MRIEDLAAYEIISRQKIHDLRSEGYLLRHKKSGARIALLSNEDENKVFYIGFKTPPADSTGVAHILEHSVLEGSKEFPVKDPFIELVKGSMNTFLNAMTYPDKTMYPVASCNDKDFQKRVCLRQQAIDTSDDRSLFIIHGDNDGDLVHDRFPPSENRMVWFGDAYVLDEAGMWFCWHAWVRFPKRSCNTS